MDGISSAHQAELKQMCREYKGRVGDDDSLGTMRHIPSCKIKQDFDFPGASSCTVEI